MKATLQLIVYMIKSGIPKAAPPQSTTNPTQRDQLLESVLDDTVWEHDLMGTPAGNPPREIRRIEELLLVAQSEKPTAPQLDNLAQGEGNEVFHLTFSNEDLVIMDEWQDDIMAHRKQYPLPSHGDKGPECSNKLATQPHKRHIPYPRDLRHIQRKAQLCPLAKDLTACL